MEPVNVGAVHNGRELPGTHSQGGTHRGETQHHLVRGGNLWGLNYILFPMI